MKTIYVTLFLVLGVAFLSAAQTSPKKLYTRNFKSAPVEIVKVKLNGIELKPDETFTPSANWPSNLEVTVKNVSEQPVSFVEVRLYSDAKDADGKTTFNAWLRFGAFKSNNPVFIMPGEKAVLSDIEPHGDIFNFPSASIIVQKVNWNNDTSRIWSAGKILIEGEGGKRYYPERPTGAK